MTVPGGAGSTSGGSRDGVEVANDELLGIGEAHETTNDAPKVGPATQQSVRPAAGEQSGDEEVANE